MEDAFNTYQLIPWRSRLKLHWPSRNEQRSGVSFLRTSKQVLEEALPWLYRTNWLKLEIRGQSHYYDNPKYFVDIFRSVPFISDRYSAAKPGYREVVLNDNIAEHLLQSARGYVLDIRYSNFAEDEEFSSQPDIRTRQKTLINQIRQLCFIFNNCKYLRELKMNFQLSTNKVDAVFELLKPILSLRGLRIFSISVNVELSSTTYFEITGEYKEYIEKIVRSPRGTVAPAFDKGLYKSYTIV